MRTMRLHAEISNHAGLTKDYFLIPTDRGTVRVTNSDGSGDYTVAPLADGWICNCPGYQKYGECKHAGAIKKAVEIFTSLGSKG